MRSALMNLTRKMFIQASLGTAAALLSGCSGESDPADGVGGDAGQGSGGSRAGSGGSASGSGPNGSGGANSASGGSATGGSNSGSGGAAAAACTEDIDTLSSMTEGGGGHQHRVIITMAMLEAGVDVTVQTQQGSGEPGGSHCHQIELTSADIATIKSGGTVKKVTCNGGDHEFVLSCAANADEPQPPTSCAGDAPGACG